MAPVLLSTLYSGPNSTVYRAYSETLKKNCIVKLHNDEYLSISSRNKLTREYNVGKSLHSINEGCMLEYYALEAVDKSLRIIMEDFEGESLEQILSKSTKKKFDALEFITLAEKMLDCIIHIHQNKTLHEALYPGHFLWNREKGVVKLIDFGSSSQIEEEHRPVMNVNNIRQGLINYVSPEQTGRMNRGIDYRSDIYSLGVIFYELCTGDLPFTDAEDSLEVVYKCIAKIPSPPHIVCPEVPKCISDVIMHMLVKNSDERYQSAHGVKQDLISCQRFLNQPQTCTEQLVVGSSDVRSTFHVNQKLYGRDEEVLKLMNSFEQVANGTTSTMLMLVSGYSGVGKSRLINEVHKPLVRQKGYFICGKFDQFKRNIPYSAFIQAFQQLMLSLLTESNDKIQYWQKNLMSALGSNAAVLLEFLPSLQHIIGPQPPVAELNPAENTNRFKSVFHSFLNVFAQREHPLVIFLDDLQWADSGTLSMIESIITSPLSQYVLLFGAYRDNEITDVHPLTSTIQAISDCRTGGCVDYIRLKPLLLEHVTNLTADTLHLNNNVQVNELAQLIHEKTHGNPFFVVVFLTGLARQGLVSYDFGYGHWKFDLPKIKQLGITDNVVEMMSKRIQGLPDNTQRVLSLAATIGNKFNFDFLSTVYNNNKQNQISVKECSEALWPAIKDGLVMQTDQSPGASRWTSEHDLNDSYLCSTQELQFLHDRVQQAAYELVRDPDEKIKMHLLIGWLSYARYNSEQTQTTDDDSLFDILHHFKKSKVLLVEACERELLAKLSCRAGKRAKDNTAYQTAAEFLLFGIELMAPYEQEAWLDDRYKLMMDLYIKRCECEYLRGHFDLAESIYPTLIKRAKNIFDMIFIYNVQVRQYEVQNRFSEVVVILKNCLQLLDIHIPTDDNDAMDRRIQQEMNQVQINLAGRRIEDLIKEPEIHSQKDVAVISILVSIWAPCYALGYYRLLRLCSVMLANVSLVTGNCDVSGPAYVYYAFIAGALNGDYNQAHEFAKLGLALSHKYDNLPMRCKCMFVFSMLMVWVEPVKLEIEMLEKTFHLAMEVGDLAYAAYCTHYFVTDGVFFGEDLVTCFKKHQKYLTFLKNNNPFIYNYCISASQHIRWLWMPVATSTITCAMLDHHDFDDEKFVQLYGTQSYLMGGYNYGRAVKSYLSRDSTRWIRDADRAYDTVPEALVGSFKIIEIQFWCAMIYLAHDYDGDHVLRTSCMNKVHEVIERLHHFNQFCPHNIHHKLCLLQAELERVNGNLEHGLELFEQAIELCMQNGFHHFEALANELLGRLWVHSKKRLKYAKPHLQESLYLYNQWGAVGKVEQLLKQFDFLQRPKDLKYPMVIAAGDVDAIIKQTTNHNGDSNHIHSDQIELDTMTVLKATQIVINDTMSLDQFLNDMMNIVIKTTAASRGVYIQYDIDDEKYTVIAEGNADALQINSLCAMPLTSYNDVPKSVVHYVARTKEPLMISDCNNAQEITSLRLESDPYLQSHPVKSFFCYPIIKHNDLKGILYLENNLTTDAFSEKRTQVISMLTSHITITLENASFAQILESEKRYRKLTSELEVVRKGLEEFIDVLCHELRNPLNAIYGSNQVVKELLQSLGEKASAKVKATTTVQDFQKIVLSYISEFDEAIHSMTISSDHLKDIVDTVLTASMLENDGVKLQSVPYNLIESLEEMIIMFKARAHEKKVRLEKKIINGDDIMIVIGDPVRFKEIIINLLSNALKFTQEEGTITIIYEQLERDDTHVTICVSVRDTGIGMTPEEISRLFQPFSQANDSTYNTFGGSGLGLKITKEMVELMGGTISVDSTPGSGSQFKFQLTLRTSDDNKLVESAIQYRRVSSELGNTLNQESYNRLRRVRKQSEDKLLPNSSETRRGSVVDVLLLQQLQSPTTMVAARDNSTFCVLIVEDNSINQKLLVRIIKNEMYQYDVACNGEEAVDKFKEKKFDIILMDLEMPVMNGVEATIAIRRLEAESGALATPIVGVSANARLEHSQAAIAAGMQGYLTKPYQKKDILNTVDAFLKE
ncbi:hybrid signal transduction histidine kinase dhkG [Acrasis kona]|uniref:Hybrid signal transduction histidine kinase dhkG n=1 Tax=Acrasis kona TaxID=1008807 RepID=A0AAW2YJY9_9EUKA